MKKISILLIMIICLCGCGKKEKQLMQLSLEGNITTGYEWSCNLNDEEIIRIVSNEYMPKKVENGLAGSGGFWQILFEGLKEGNATITCEYAKSFEDIEPFYKINYNVEVDESNNISIINKSGTYETEIIPDIKKK